MCQNLSQFKNNTYVRVCYITQNKDNLGSSAVFKPKTCYFCRKQIVVVIMKAFSTRKSTNYNEDLEGFDFFRSVLYYSVNYSYTFLAVIC